MCISPSASGKQWPRWQWPRWVLTFAFSIILLVPVATSTGGCEGNALPDSSAAAPSAPSGAQTVSSVPAAADTTIEASRQNAVTQAVEAATPAVVSIGVRKVQRVRDPFANDPFFRYFMQRPQYREARSMGSGFVMSPNGYTVTNEHVVNNARDIEVYFPDGETYPAELVGSDRLTDLALLKIDAEDLAHLTFDTDSDPIPGEWVIALGNPFGLFEAAEPSVTVGVVSVTNRNLQSQRDGRLYRNMIQTDAAINRGNSGGPLLNALGEVIGVNTAIYSDSGGSVGIGFAVPSARAVEILEGLRTNGSVDRSHYTGLDVVEVTERIARALGLSEVRGLIVRDTDPGSPAGAAGFQPYDVILEVEGTRVNSRDDYVARIFDFRPGDELRFTIERDGTRRTLTLTLGRRG